jgi:hypothetical protein
MKNKKADMVMVFLTSIVILTLSLIIITIVWDKFFHKAEESAAESLCMGFNAVRMHSKVDQGQMSFNTIPNTCKTLDKTVPSNIYPQTKEGALEEMRTLVAKCWWMFLEGAEKNMFAKDLWIGNDPCFTCYRFNIKNNIDEITFDEFKKSLIETTYLAGIDEDFDDCAPIGGGKCIDDKGEKICESDEKKYKELTKEVYSTKCEKGQHCCIASKNYECKNKGGKCLDLSEGEFCEDKDKEYNRQYDKWACRTGTCCIKSDNYYSYLTYVQHYRGDGAIIYEEDLVFKPGEEYAITLISPGSDFDWKFAGKGVGTVIGAGVLTFLFSYITVPIAVVVGVATMGGGGAYTYLSGEQKLEDINTLFLSKLDTVSNKCEIQPGTDVK